MNTLQRALERYYDRYNRTYTSILKLLSRIKPNDQLDVKFTTEYTAQPWRRKLFTAHEHFCKIATKIQKCRKKFRWGGVV